MSPLPSLLKPRQTGNRWSNYFSTLFIVLPLILSVWVLSLRGCNNSAIRKLESAARQRGEPITLAELAAQYPPIPDEENAAIPLLELWQSEDPEFWLAFKSGKKSLPDRKKGTFDPALPYLGSKAQRPPRAEPLSSNSLAAAEAFLATNVAHLAQVRAALSRPRCRFPIHLEDGPDALLPHLSVLKLEAKSLQLTALMATLQNRPDETIAALRDTARLGQLLSDEPILISQLSRVTCLAMVLEGAEQLLSRHPLTPAQLDELQQLLAQLQVKRWARATLIYDRPFSLWICNADALAQSAANSAPGAEHENPVKEAQENRRVFHILETIGYLPSERRFLLETFDQAITLAATETPHSLQRIEEVFRNATARARKFPPKFFTSLMLPSLEGVPARFATFEARRRSALLALTIERFRIENDDILPDDLDALIAAEDEIATDPFDGQRLRYRLLDRGYLIYSVGADRQDNGGHEQRRGNTKPTDLTFTVER